MRVLVAFFLVIGFGVLRFASTTGSASWAWVSAGLSVAAVGVLVADWRGKSASVVGEVAAFEHVAEVPGMLDSDASSTPPAVAGQPQGSAEWGPEDDLRTNGPGAEEPLKADSAVDTGRAQGLPVGSVDPDVAGEDSAGLPSGVASLFIPLTPVEPEPSQSDDGYPQSVPVFEPVEPGPSDATVVFARVPSDGADDDPGTCTDGAVRRSGGEVAHQPGEERADDQASAVVAFLDDEVLVVDELPRFHVAGCSSLAGHATIALMARDAVELEFTPCALCEPVRELTDAASRRTGRPEREEAGMLSGAQPE